MACSGKGGIENKRSTVVVFRRTGFARLYEHSPGSSVTRGVIEHMQSTNVVVQRTESSRLHEHSTASIRACTLKVSHAGTSDLDTSACPQ